MVTIDQVSSSALSVELVISCQSKSLPIHSQVTDESELMNYRSQLEQWEVRQEEKKHMFTITQADLSWGSSNTAIPPKAGKVGTVAMI